MDGTEGAVVVYDVKLLTTSFGIPGGEVEQIQIQRAEVLVLAAQVVQFIHGGRSKIYSQYVVPQCFSSCNRQ